jgi:hypothetical protein
MSRCDLLDCQNLDGGGTDVIFAWRGREEHIQVGSALRFDLP